MFYKCGIADFSPLMEWKLPSVQFADDVFPPVPVKPSFHTQLKEVVDYQLQLGAKK